MPPDFLRRLNVSEEERRKLASLGASTPLALLAMRQAAPEAFEAHLGPQRAGPIAAELFALLSDEERERLAEPAPLPGALGARLSAPAAPLEDPPYDLARRDRLFDELQRLRRLPRPSLAEKTRMAQLEGALEDLFRGEG
jgi:hypothetical protein